MELWLSMEGHKAEWLIQLGHLWCESTQLSHRNCNKFPSYCLKFEYFSKSTVYIFQTISAQIDLDSTIPNKNPLHLQTTNVWSILHQCGSHLSIRFKTFASRSWRSYWVYQMSLSHLTNLTHSHHEWANYSEPIALIIPLMAPVIPTCYCPHPN